MIAALRTASSEWWSGRNARERSLLLAAGGLFAAVLVWVLVVSPILESRARALRAYDSALTLYTGMTEGAREAARLRRSAPGGESGAEPGAQPGENLRTAASIAARDLGLQIVRTQPGEGGSLAFVFDAADPADLFRWMEAIQSRYGASPASVTLRRNAGARTVQANVLMVEAR